MKVSLKVKIRQLLYWLVYSALEFVFFFTSYWWLKLQWLLLRFYWGTSIFKIYEAGKSQISQGQNFSEENFAYGETTALSAKLILSEINPKKGQLIYDLGAGRGVFLFAASFLYGLRGIGIEIFQDYVERSLKIRKGMKTPGIIFRQGNILDVDFSDGDIIYLAGATFDETVINSLIENLKKVPSETIVITVRNKLPEEEFVLFKDGVYPFSWGADQVYFYRRK